MSPPVTIESDLLRMTVWPQIGGKVASIVDKSDSFDLLFNYPAELPSSPSYDTPYGNGWYAGWDECFPAVAAGKYVGHPYDGIAVPDHGELWGIPVSTAVPTKNGITTVWNGLRFGYRLTRKLYLDGPSIVAEYQLTNLAPYEFKFVWAMHSLMSLAAPVALNPPAAGGAWRYSHDAAGHDVQRPFDWPTITDGVDLSDFAALPSRRAWKVFSTQPIDAPMIVRYPTRNRTLRIEYSCEDLLSAYWGIWINTGGSAGHRHFSVEPTTGRYDQLDRAIADGSAGLVGPLERRVWSVRWTVG